MNILYGLPSEGMGHATRSDVVIQYLLNQGYEVEVITSDRAFDFLNKKYPGRVHPIEGFHLAFKGTEVSVGKTLFQTVKSAPQKIKTNWKQYFQFLRHKQFDVVISDFETYSALYAALHRIPLISLDNIQVIDRCKASIRIPKEEKKNYAVAKQVVKLKVPGADRYLISSFFDIETKKKNTYIIPSILREAVLQLQPKFEQHILIYQYVTPEDELLEVLRHFPKEQFYVFGFNKEADYGNIQLRKFSEVEFLNLFAAAKAVMCHGGFSFISEAVYLKKPIYAVPIPNQFEQFFNAAYIEKMGYGAHAKQFDVEGIQAFLSKQNLYQVNLSSYSQDGNTLLFKALDETLKQVVGTKAGMVIPR